MRRLPRPGVPVPHAPSPRVPVRLARCAFRRRAASQLANLVGIADLTLEGPPIEDIVARSYREGL